MQTKHKRIDEVKAAPDGTVEAVIATLNVKDHDGDWTEKGFFGSQPASIVGSHNWADIMLGKGTVTDDDGTAAVFKGRLNLDDPAAKALHSKLMFDMAHEPPLIEWSYGFEVLPGGAKADERGGEQVQVFGPRADGSPGAKVFEVSPVLAGAGIGTGTLVAKNRTDLKLVDLVSANLDEVEHIMKAVTDLDDLTDAKRAALAAWEVALKQAASTVSAALTPPPEDTPATEARGFGLLQAQYAHLRRTQHA